MGAVRRNGACGCVERAEGVDKPSSQQRVKSEKQGAQRCPHRAHLEKRFPGFEQGQHGEDDLCPSFFSFLSMFCAMLKQDRRGQDCPALVALVAHTGRFLVARSHLVPSAEMTRKHGWKMLFPRYGTSRLVPSCGFR